MTHTPQSNARMGTQDGIQTHKARARQASAYAEGLLSLYLWAKCRLPSCPTVAMLTPHTSPSSGHQESPLSS